MRVKGDCPHGCGQRLVLQGDGTIACTMPTCPDPYSIDRLLNDIRLRDALRHAVSQ